MDLSNRVTLDDYQQVAGKSWPSYNDFCQGQWGNNAYLIKEIQEFVDGIPAQEEHSFYSGEPFTFDVGLYISSEDYALVAGEDWPVYTDFCQGVKTTNAEVQKEIDSVVDRYVTAGVKFPINTPTACQSKWTWSTIYLNQHSTASCHRVTPFKFSLEDFDNFHNIPEKIRQREAMLRGEWPGQGCEYCRDIEQAGGFSDRLHNLEIRGLTPIELIRDPNATVVTPRIVEIFAKNTCNLSCTYCNANLSSKIEDENRRFGEFNQNGVVIPVHDSHDPQTNEYLDRFLIWIENNIHNLRRLHLLGGETFIQHDLMTRVLDIIEQKPNRDLEFCTFSNLNVPDTIWDKYINRIKDLQAAGHIKCFDLTASIDCWGKEAEYARFGLNLDKFESRLDWAAQQGSWLRLNVNQTVTALTMRTMVDLVKKIDHYSQHRHIGHYFQFYTGPQMFQHPKTYAYSLWDNDMTNVLNAMPSHTPEQKEAIPRMIGLKKLLEQHTAHNYAEIEKLKIYLDELDRRRSTNWRGIFPYLDINEQT